MKNIKKYSLEEIQHIGYEAFKLNWLIQHGYTAADILAKYSDYWGEVESDEEGMNDFWNWLNDTGFNGEIWPCFKEFLDHEFQDVSLMYRLFSPEQYTFYLGFLPKIMANTDYPTKHLSYVKAGEVLLYDGCRYTAVSDAYMTETDIGKEWNVEVESDEGCEEYLYASYFHQGEVQIVPEDASDEDCDGECVGCERACADRISVEEGAV